MYVLRIISMDKILHFINTLIIIIKPLIIVIKPDYFDLSAARGNMLQHASVGVVRCKCYEAEWPVSVCDWHLQHTIRRLLRSEGEQRATQILH